jgi:H+/gluconate symporter-like permease
MYTGLFQDQMVIFAKLYFPPFLLGAIFGKLVEVSGYARSISSAIVRAVGRDRVVVAITVLAMLLTYGGVSMFVTVFAVYPFAVEMFRQSDIPKRLIPVAIFVGAFTVTMDALPGSPQIQNIIPTSFFKTTSLAAPVLGTIGAIFLLTIAILFLEYRVRQARLSGEGYGTGHINEPELAPDAELPNPVVAISPLVLVCVLNSVFTLWVIPAAFGTTSQVVLSPGGKAIVQEVARFNGIWSVVAALFFGILFICVMSYKTILPKFQDATKTAVGGALLAIMNTSSEFGFGSVIAALPGFAMIKSALNVVPYPPLNEAITINVLAGITGSASGGMSIALAAMSDQFIAAANAAHIPLEVMHRVASMASGGLDTLPHNGAVITLLAVCGLTHRQSYPDIFVLTLLKIFTAFVVVFIYYMTGLV